jgi:hypothetical protein
LINRLPTSPQEFSKIVKLEGIRGVEEKNWNLILDQNSNYKLLYNLQIIEYLMDNNNIQEDKDFHSFLTGNNEELIGLIQSWRSDFINFGGFDHLVQIYHTFKTKEYNTYTIFDKKILGFVLNILRNYLMITFSTEIDGLYQQVQLARRTNLTLDFIQKYISDPEFDLPAL